MIRRTMLTLAVVAGLSTQPVTAQGCDTNPPTCDNASVLSVVELGDSTGTGSFCNPFSSCADPVVESLSYSKTDPMCNPKTTVGGCEMTADVQVKFPGNRNNFCDHNTILAGAFYRRNGSVQAQCGRTNSWTIDDDLALFTVTASGVTCDSTTTHRLDAIMCGPPICPGFTTFVPLDFVNSEASGCNPVHIPNGCAESDSGAEMCCFGAGGANGPPGAPPGFGLDGTNAKFAYQAMGAGHPKSISGSSWVSDTGLGRYWIHEFATRIAPDPDASHVYLITRSGTFREFTDTNSDDLYDQVSPSDEHRTLEYNQPGAGEWTLTGLDGTVTVFNSDGSFQSRADRLGNAWTATYSGGLLDTVTFPDKRMELFTYSAGRLQIIDQVGLENDGSQADCSDPTECRTWMFTWSGDDLQRIDYPDGTAREFVYGNSNLPGYMTKRELVGTDGSRRIEAAWEYTSSGRIARVWKGAETFAGGVETYEYAYDDETAPTSVVITDPFGNPATYTLDYDDESTKPKLVSVSGECPSCGGPEDQYEYDDPSNPLRPTARIDGEGHRTEFTYNPNGTVATRTDGAGSGEARLVSFGYDVNFQGLRTLEQWPSTETGFRQTSWAYDGVSGVLESMTIEGAEIGYDEEPPDGNPEDAFVLTTNYRNHNAAGQPGEIDPPGFGQPGDPSDMTTFTYDPDRNGLLADSRTDPLVGTTLFGYDGLNRRTMVTDPNGVVTETSYDPLDRVDQVIQAEGTAGALLTDYEYDAFGDLEKVVRPRGNATVYEHDGAGRLVKVRQQTDKDTLTVGDEQVFYTLNGFGQRTREEQQVWDGAAWQTEMATEYEYSSRCYLDKIVHDPDGARTEITEHSYTCDGSLEHVWDQNHPSSSQTAPPTQVYVYDALDRLVELREPWVAGTDCRGATVPADCAVTTYAYSTQDHLVEVTDAELNSTTYTLSDRDRLTQEVSPVSGTTTHRYNDHGALVETNDARGVQILREVDPLDRVTAVTYPDPTLDTTYQYDIAPAVCGTSFPVGRLGSITRHGESIDYCHDELGRTTRDGDLVYSYDANSNRTGIAYPGGVTATYGFDLVADRPVSLTVDPGTGSPAQTIVSGAGYLPGGPLASLAFGNDLTETRGYDARYLPGAVTVSDAAGALLHWGYATDAVGNVESIDTVACEGAELVLAGQTVATKRSYEHCDTVRAGAGFEIAGPDGEVAMTAGVTVVLEDGFSVTGGSFSAGTDASLQAGQPVARSFEYKPVQYFLTAADGPWGELDWTYDRIGNRLTEVARDSQGGLLRDDAYAYASNGTGNTPILDQMVQNATLGTRSYTWDAAGNLDSIDASGNLVDFAFDPEGRMAEAHRALATEKANFTYDGRSFLTSAAQTDGGTDTLEALYDSGGLLHRLVVADGSGSLSLSAMRRTMAEGRLFTGLPSASSPPTPTGGSDPDGGDLLEPTGDGGVSGYGAHYFFYLAGRPVAQLTIDDLGQESWLFFTTDHLGTPILACDEEGGEVWEGGFEPFGRDWQAGTGGGALESGVFLRLPGQFDSEVWAEATLGGELFYNVARWYERGVARYTAPDPLGLEGGVNPYAYAHARPLFFVDLLGLDVAQVCCRPLQPTGAWRVINVVLRIATPHFQVKGNHCYIRQADDDGQTVRTWSLINDDGTGRPEFDHPSDSGYQPQSGDCGDPICLSEDMRRCLDARTLRYPVRSYPEGGGVTPLTALGGTTSGPNSNSFTQSLVSCGVSEPPWIDDNQAPGWFYWPRVGRRP